MFNVKCNVKFTALLNITSMIVYRFLSLQLPCRPEKTIKASSNIATVYDLSDKEKND